MGLRRFVLGGFLLAAACGDDEASDGEGTSPTSTSPSTSDASSGTDPSSTDPTSGTDPTSSTDPTTSTSVTTTSDATDWSTSSGDESSSSGDAPFDLPCGDELTCTGGDVCVEDVFEPECTNLEDPDGMCPDGQNMTNCGGDGQPCCCLPPPASEFRCVTPTDCVGPASCECLGKSLCTDDRECISLGADPEHLFRCETPPPP